MQYRLRTPPPLFTCAPVTFLPRSRGKGTSGGTALQFGACRDSQVAQDTNRMSGTVHTGAATV
jgi:hypothetical protein